MLSSPWKKGVGGVASAAGSDARRRDEGDAGAHRGGAATPQTARAAATPWGGRPFARGDGKEESRRKWDRPGRRGMQKAGRDARIHFATGCSRRVALKAGRNVFSRFWKSRAVAPTSLRQ